jgi:hypothetical protein
MASTNSNSNFNSTYIWAGVGVVVIVTIIGLVVYTSKKQNEKYGEYNTTTVGPDPFVSVLPKMMTKVYNYRNEFVKAEPLEKVLKTIQPYEKFAVCSTDNPIAYTRPLQDIPQVMKFMTPYMERMLALRGLKLAKNPNDGQYIYKFVEADGYDYPIGLWLYVAKADSVY